MITISSRYRLLLTFSLGLALILASLAPQLALAQGPQERPDIPHGHGSRSSDGASTDSETGRIVLTTRPGAWTVVQWQDGSDYWHDVAGWRGHATDGAIAWTVEEKDFGTGPFRWVVTHPQSGRPTDVSQSFYLPGAGDTLAIEIQGSWHYSHPQRPWPQRWPSARPCAR